MKSAILTGLLAAAAMASAGSVRAEPVDLTLSSQGYTYFNRPGADMATHDRELFDCALEAARTLDPQQNPRLAGAQYMLDGALSRGYTGLPAKYGFNASLENCMVIRGWRVVRLDPQQGKPLAKRPQPEVAAFLQNQIGSASPAGEVIRAWNNDALLSSTIRFRPADRPAGTSLSFLGRAPQPDDKSRIDPIVAIPPPMFIPGYPIRPKSLKPEQIRAALPNKAIIIFRLRGLPTVKGTTFYFEHKPLQPDPALWPDDNLPEEFNVGLPLATYGRTGAMQEHTIVLAVAPGRWILAQEGRLLFTESYCLGAPGFDVQAGEVVYAGSFELSAPDWAPNMDMTPAQQALTQTPELLPKLRVASWVNGNRTVCVGSDLYSLEFPGAPYADGYAWGGALPKP